MMSSGDPRVPPPILPHPNHQTTANTSGSAGNGGGHTHGHGHGHGHSAGGSGGSGSSGDGTGGQQQAPQKPRAPKAYTEPQMAFLKSHLEEFEKRSAGPVRGDAKKYALEQASGFVLRFGLPPEFQPLEEGETRFKEQIYNWFKNTIGRKRRQAEGKPRSVKSANSASNSSKAKDKSVASSSMMPSTAGQSNSGSATLSPDLQWTPIPQQAQSHLSSSAAQANSLAAFAGHNHNPGPHVAESSSSSPALGTIQQPQAISLGQMHFGLHTPQQTPQHVHSHTPPVSQPATSHSTHHQQQQHQQHQHQHQHSTHSSHSSHHSPHEQQHPNSAHPLPAPTPVRVGQGQQQQQPQQSLSHAHVNQETLRDAFLSPSVEAPTLASMIQIFVSSCPPSVTPLTTVVEILFSASTSSGPSSSYPNCGSSRTMEDLSPLYPNSGSSSKATDPGNYGNISLKGPNTPHPLAHHSYGGGSSAHRGDGGQSGYSRDPTPLVQRFCDASRYWGTSIVHCNLTGVDAAGRALIGLVRKWSVWQQPNSSLSMPTSGSAGGGFNSVNTASSSLGMAALGLQAGGGGSLHGGLSMSGYGSKLASPGPGHAGVASSSGSSLTEEMQRITAERQRRKDHIQWARIHAGALEVGLIGAPSPLQPAAGTASNDSTQSYGRYIAERAFSEMVARDAVWEEDEAEWVAGLYVLRGLIRSAVRGNKPFGAGVERRQREEYREMLRVYEGRWKEIKDEVRQSLATEALFSAKEELDGMTS